MPHPVSPVSLRPSVVTSDLAQGASVADRPAREVPDAQLWRDAIGAAQRASAAVAELRLAIEAARPTARS